MKTQETTKAKPKKKASGASNKSAKVESTTPKAKKTGIRSTGDRRQFPAPWKLQGEGFLFPLFSKKAYNLESSFMDEEDRKSYGGGLGALLFVNYSSSDVGPYHEVLYIPGNFEWNGKKFKRITRIFVSSRESVEAGRRNWAIPKEQADFVWTRQNSVTKIEVSRDGKLFLRASIRTIGLNFPVSTSPFGLSLLQKQDGEYLNTSFNGTGKGKFARLENLWIDETVFPDFLKAGGFRTGFGISPFEMVFPEAIKQTESSTIQ